MLGTIESTNGKIIEKISQLKTIVNDIAKIINQLRDTRLGGAQQAYYKKRLDTVLVNILRDELETLENNYNLSVIGVLGDYYESRDNEEEKTNNYYRTITSENFVSGIDHAALRCVCAVKTLQEALRLRVPAEANIGFERKLARISRNIETAQSIEISLKLDSRNFEICKCGSRMIVIAELSEMRCQTCPKVKTIIGAVFRDDQFYPQDGQKTKHSGYDTSRHYRFWIERLQALENKSFDPWVMERIEYVLQRDSYDKNTLNCENMREILKDSMVKSTALNDHAPLLVKMFGGPAPPQLTFQEHRTLSIRFNKAMALYDVINLEGGNKPYYPYFIYKIIEHEFRGNKDKLRLLGSIHLQSRETVIKNDKYFEEICRLADPEDGLVYSPTDPALR